MDDKTLSDALRDAINRMSGAELLGSIRGCDDANQRMIMKYQELAREASTGLDWPSPETMCAAYEAEAIKRGFLKAPETPAITQSSDSAHRHTRP